MMNSWSDVFLVARDWLTAIWDGIFGIEIFDGLTFKILFMGILVVFFTITIFRFFISNTHAELGATESVTYTNVSGRDNITGRPISKDTLTTSRTQRHRTRH